MKKTKQKKNNKLILPLIIVALIVLVGALIFLAKQKQSQSPAAELKIRELIGNTLEERLAARNIDSNQATITKIENVEQIRSRYSGLLKNAKNGQYLIELPERVLVYDFEHDEIVSEFAFQRIDLGERAS